MPLERDVKAEIVLEYGRDASDTGSPEVQIALMSQRIRDLTMHLKAHKHDFHSTHGLKKIIGARGRLLRYLKREDMARYQDLIKRLGLRR